MSACRDRVVFLVGAGLVKDARLPTSIELANKLKIDLESRRADEKLTVEDRTEAGRFLSFVRFLSGGIRFKEGLLNRDPDAPINIEQIASAALALSGRLENPLAPYSSGWHQRLSELEAMAPTLTEGFMDFIYSRLESWLTQEDLSTIAYVGRIADVASSRRAVDIFSLNYDLCIESILKTQTELIVSNGFTESGWSPATYDQDADVRLFKLHGSLDWVEDESYGVCALRHPRHRDAEDIEGAHKPLLIFGTSQKLSARQPFLTLAYHFSQATLLSRVLVIVGYSFQDAYINEIFEQAFRSNTTLRIVVVGPSATQLANNQRLLKSSPRVKCIDLGAKAAFNDGHVQRAVEFFLAESAEDTVF